MINLRIGATRPDISLINWESLNIVNESLKERIIEILSEQAQINSYMTKLYELGLKMKQIASLFGCSESTVSLRLSGKVGETEGLAKRKKDYVKRYEKEVDVQEKCPHSDYLYDTLRGHGQSLRKTNQIMRIYVSSYPRYDNPNTLYRLLRVHRISKERALLILSEFFLEDIIPDALSDFHEED